MLRIDVKYVTKNVKLHLAVVNKNIYSFFILKIKFPKRKVKQIMQIINQIIYKS
jgi:hypothetical protein